MVDPLMPPAHAGRRPPPTRAHRPAGRRLARPATTLLLLGTAATASPLAAQDVRATAQEASTRPGPAAVTGRDLTTLGAVTAAAFALSAVDERVARWSQRRVVQDAPSLRPAAAVLRAVGDPGVFAIGGVTYVVGLARRDRATADVGLHTAGAIVASGVLTGLVKMSVGRARPYVTGDSNAHSFAFGRGLRRGNAYQSFPSGHSTAAFAFAAALSAEGRHRWPATNRVTEPLAYTAATLVALSRVYHDRHWASDVVMGAGVGLVTGRALVRYQHARPNNAGDGRLLPRRTSARAVPFPASLGWTVTF